MKKILAIGAAAAALMSASSVASAQECIGGWTMIKDQIPVRCDTLPSAFSGPGIVEEPMFTGSIGVAPVEPTSDEPTFTGAVDETVVLNSESEQPPRPGGPGSAYSFAASRDECAPGQYWMMELNSGNRPVAC